MDWILDLLTQLRTTSNYSTIANLHTLQITTAAAMPFPACCVLTSHSLATASTVEILQHPVLRLSCHSWPCEPLSNLKRQLPGWQPSHTNLLVLTLDWALNSQLTTNAFLHSRTFNSQLKPKLVVISHQPPSLLFKGWFINCWLSIYCLSVINSVGLGSSLYSFGVDPRENTTFSSSSIVIGTFTNLLPRNDRLLIHLLKSNGCTHCNMTVMYPH
jgi:hypothetical protein